MIKDQFTFLTMVYTDMELTLLKNYLSANGIPITTREKGFGGPIRSLFMGSFTPAQIEIFVKKEDYEDATMLMDYSAFNAELDEEEWMKEEDESKKNYS